MESLDKGKIEDEYKVSLPEEGYVDTNYGGVGARVKLIIRCIGYGIRSLISLTLKRMQLQILISRKVLSSVS